MQPIVVGYEVSTTILLCLEEMVCIGLMLPTHSIPSQKSSKPVSCFRLFVS